jgi:hypothetical protein
MDWTLRSGSEQEMPSQPHGLGSDGLQVVRRWAVALKAATLGFGRYGARGTGCMHAPAARVAGVGGYDMGNRGRRRRRDSGRP